MDTICPKAIILQHLTFWIINLGHRIVLYIFFGTVIFRGDLSDFHPVMAGELGLWESYFLAP